MSNNVKGEKRNCLRKLMILWGMLVIGHVVALLPYCGFPTAFTCKDMRLVAFLPISAIAFAAIGPLSIVSFFFTVFRVHGGTTEDVRRFLYDVNLAHLYVCSKGDARGSAEGFGQDLQD